MQNRNAPGRGGPGVGRGLVVALAGPKAVLIIAPAAAIAVDGVAVIATSGANAPKTIWSRM